MQESIVDIKAASEIMSTKMEEVRIESASSRRASIVTLSQAGVDAQNSLKDMLKDGLENAKCMLSLPPLTCFAADFAKGEKGAND